MSTLASDSKLVTPCYFRADGVMCIDGMLFYSKGTEREISPELRARLVRHPEQLEHPEESVIRVYHTPIQVESERVQCPACEGKGVILTERGKEILMFFQTFLRPVLYEICSDYIDDKLGLS